MGAPASASGPDFSNGVNLAEIPLRGMVAGRVGDQPVLVSRFDDEFYAVGGVCTHYGAALADGMVDGETVRCPLHHACFSLRTGAALRAPAFDGLPRWRVEIEGALVFVRERAKESEARPAAASSDEVRDILIVGGGGAGFACAHELREQGYRGNLVLVSADGDPPCDRPNLSKDFLAGSAPAEWIPLRDEAYYRNAAIDLRLGTEIVAIDAMRRTARARDGEAFRYDRLLLATGAEPVRLRAPGFDRDNVHVLRSLGDARALAARAKPGARAAIIGSSFIGLEAAAALRARGVAVEIVSMDEVPFARVLGAEIGRFVQAMHEEHGVAFHLGRTAAGYDGRALRLDDGTAIAADFLLVGIGVRPRTDLAASARISHGDGILVDSLLETSQKGIYAAGDIALYPDPLTGLPVRIEHWVTALGQGRTAARNMLGGVERFVVTPFFWTEQYGVAIRYVGHAADWDEVRIDGDVAGRDFTARYFEKGELRASASVGRDLENLQDEWMLEKFAQASTIRLRHDLGTYAAA